LLCENTGAIALALLDLTAGGWLAGWLAGSQTK